MSSQGRRQSRSLQKW